MASVKGWRSKGSVPLRMSGPISAMYCIYMYPCDIGMSLLFDRFPQLVK